jgi:hypothetical protein
MLTNLLFSSLSNGTFCLIKVVLLVVVQNFAARGLALDKNQTNLPPLYSTEKKYFFHISIQIFSHVFLFNNLLELTN